MGLEEKEMSKKLQQSAPTLGPKGPPMSGKPGHWFYACPKFGEKIIVESWETPKGYRHGWRIMAGSSVKTSDDSKPDKGEQATANAAARWIGDRSYYYGALGVK